jgi:two-component system, sensor histidine kinase
MVPASMDPEVVGDLQEMERRNPGVLQGLLARFIAHQKAFLADPRCQGDALDLDFVRAGAHRLKGSAGSLGARGLAECASRVELAALADDVAATRHQLGLLRATFDEVVPVVGQLYGVPS